MKKEKTGLERSGPTPSTFRPAGWRQALRVAQDLLLPLSQPMLSTPLTAKFGPGPEGASEGCAAGRRFCSLHLSPPTLGLARRGVGGALSWTGFLLCTPHASDVGPAAEGCAAGQGIALYASRRRLRAWRGGEPLMGWRRPSPLLCELNLLSRPCGAGWVNKESAGPLCRRRNIPVDLTARAV